MSFAIRVAELQIIFTLCFTRLQLVVGALVGGAVGGIGGGALITAPINNDISSLRSTDSMIMNDLSTTNTMATNTMNMVNTNTMNLGNACTAVSI